MERAQPCPPEVPAAEIETWAGELDWHVASDCLSALAARSPHARALAARWIRSKGEWTSRCGWHLVARLARDGTVSECETPDAAPYIARARKRLRGRALDRSA
jgi:hypothetical protein